MKKKITITSILFISILLISPASALDQSTMRFYSKNNILYYNPSGVNGCIESSSISINSSLPETAIQKIESANVKEKVQQNMKRYIYAQKETGLPWQILAAIHYREAGLDSTKSLSNGATLGSGINVDGFYVGSDANEDAKKAALHFINNAKKIYDATNFQSIDDIANGFLAYNRGYMYKSASVDYKQSPYVMNFYDENHQNMKWTHADSYYKQEQYNSLEGKEDGNVGALTIFKYLNGFSNSNNANSKVIDGSNITIIGDSIISASEDAIINILPQANISTEKNRTIKQTENILKNPKNSESDGQEQLEKPLRKNVIIALGSNNQIITEEGIKTIIENIGSDKNIFFITNFTTNTSYGKNFASNNKLFKSFASQNIKVIDWASKAQSGSYLSSDGLHPNEEGAALLATLISDAINLATDTSICSKSWEGDFPYYSQCDSRWGELEYGPQGVNGNTEYSSICESSCGPSSFAMMATVLLEKEITPKDTSEIAGRKGMHILNVGSSHDVTRVLAEEYGLQYTNLSWTGTVNQKIALINKYLNEGWMIHTSGSGQSPFTSGGHFIGIRALTSSGKWLVADSNGWSNNPDGNPGKKNTLETEWEPLSIVQNMSHAVAIKK